MKKTRRKNEINKLAEIFKIFFKNVFFQVLLNNGCYKKTKVNTLC